MNNLIVAGQFLARKPRKTVLFSLAGTNTYIYKVTVDEAKKKIRNKFSKI